MLFRSPPPRLVWACGCCTAAAITIGGGSWKVLCTVPSTVSCAPSGGATETGSATAKAGDTHAHVQNYIDFDIYVEGGGYKLLERLRTGALSKESLLKALDDAVICLYQNGERVRPSNGYPLRLLLPGFEGNMNVDRKRTRLNSSHEIPSRMPSSA